MMLLALAVALEGHAVASPLAEATLQQLVNMVELALVVVLIWHHAEIFPSSEAPLRLQAATRVLASAVVEAAPAVV
jgi:hypothetical protein